MTSALPYTNECADERGGPILTGTGTGAGVVVSVWYGGGSSPSAGGSGIAVASTSRETVLETVFSSFGVMLLSHTVMSTTRRVKKNRKRTGSGMPFMKEAYM